MPATHLSIAQQVEDLRSIGGGELYLILHVMQGFLSFSIHHAKCYEALNLTRKGGSCMSAKLRFGLWYDFRNPPAWKQPYDQLYGEIFDQIVWGEQHGFDDVWLSEHHFIEDGYSPSLLPIAAAIAARTKKIHIGTSVMLMPFHNPIRLAEDGATVDVISGGRFELGVGTGYKVEEFTGFALSSKERGGRTNEGLEIIRRLWEGETLSFTGRYYEVKNAKLTPEPIQRPRPPLWVGGFTPPANEIGR